MDKNTVEGNIFDAVAPPETPAVVDPQEAARVLRQIRQEVQRRTWKRSLAEFIKRAWEIVEPSKEYKHNWHIDVLCQQLEKVSRGEIKRLLINVPPGTMKSLTVSVFWPAWEWASQPELRYLTASYSSHLTIRDNLKVRSIVTSEWYRGAFGVQMDEEQNAKMLFKNTNGGWRVASSVGGPGTGEHPDRIIIDDPLTADQARSEVERLTVREWFDQTVSTRGVTRDTAIVVVMQRLHEDDLAGHLIERGGWNHICWPMRYEIKQKNNPLFKPDVLDQRTEVGQLLWPDLFTEKIVRQLELDLGPYGTAGQLQQRPAPEGGGLFKREWFKLVDAAPQMARRARGWDTASTEGAGDYTVGVKISESKGIFYIEDVARGQWGPAGVDAVMKQTAQMDGARCGVREEREGGSSGKAVIDARVKTLVGFDYRGVTVSGDKVTRARPFRAQCEAGNVMLVRGAWNEEYLREISVFPAGKHDDQVDGSSCAFNAVLLEPPPIEITLAPPPEMPHDSLWSLGKTSTTNPALGGFD